ncbi:MAG: hypothetical protein C4329_03170 [Chitinophagaceae bacterium]
MIIRAFRSVIKASLTTVLGFLFLLFVATTLFKVIRTSINQIWDVESEVRKKVITTIATRIKALAIILFLSLLFTVSILLEALQIIAHKNVSASFPHISLFLLSAMNYFISTIIIALWFGTIFKYLADAKVQWSIAWVGALFTAVFSLYRTNYITWLIELQ